MANKYKLKDRIKVHIKAWGLPVLKWVVMIAAYLYLAYKLITFNQYDALLAQWKQMPLSQWGWLLAVLILLPVNWLLEVLKWEMLTARFQKINLITAVKAVLAGISTGFFTPNRIGELVGRVMFLDAENRKAGVTMSVVNSLTQNLVIAICGVPAALVYFYYTTSNISVDIENFLLVLLAFVLIFGLFYFYLPRFSKFLSQTNIANKIVGFTGCLYEYSTADLIRIMLVSLLRFCVFSFQFFLMLRFFGIQLRLVDALIAIPTNYLFVTFSPSFAFSEAAVRSSYAVLFVGSYSGEVLNIALAGISIWAINFVIPMLVGSLVIAKEK